MSLPYYYHKANMFLDVIVLVSSTTFQTCDCSHVSLHHPRKRKSKEKKY